jgi:putative hydrolase of the HAD superfamily
MAIDTVIFDWGGTLTPWHTIDHVALWQAVCAPHFQADYRERGAELQAAELQLWEQTSPVRRSATFLSVFDQAGIEPSPGLLESYRREFEPHTFTDPAAVGVLTALRAAGMRIGVLSNTLWPRVWHDDVLRRDGVFDLIDGAVYSSELRCVKPHCDAFLAALAAAGGTDPARCVFVGDRPMDDIHGAKSAGMRAVLIPHSEVPAFELAVPDAVITDLSELPGLITSWQES